MGSRSSERVAAHYELERKLADRLRAASADDRARVYGEVYDELFRCVEDHPQLSIGAPQRDREALAESRFVSRFLDKDSCLMEIGAGDCAFSIRAAPLVHKVIAVDVSQIITSATRDIANLEVVISDGTSLPVEPSSVDVAYSDQLMEHLHPDDALAQLANVVRALKPGGVYICITPNRVTGPHDISRTFDDVATGFHLREYTAPDIRAIFLKSGFGEIRFYAGGRGRYVRMPNSVALSAEAAFERLPRNVRCRTRDWTLAHVIFGLNIVATKALTGRQRTRRRFQLTTEGGRS